MKCTEQKVDYFSKKPSHRFGTNEKHACFSAGGAKAGISLQ